MELWCDKVFPSQRKNLTVHIIDGGCQEEQRTNNPTEVGHLSSLNCAHIVSFLNSKFLILNFV